MATSDQPGIGDYALIGDCAAAALVSRGGSIDWLCWPRFDSPAMFAALLDRELGGCFRVAPVERCEVHRRYVSKTNVLETEFRCASGVVRLIDFMPVAEDECYEAELWPDHQILRLVECLEGSVEVEVDCSPRLEYGKYIPHVEHRGALGWFIHDGAMITVLRSEIPLRLHDRAHLCGRVRLQEGERRWLTIAQDCEEPAIVPALGSVAEGHLDRTIRYWQDWSNRCAYRGPYREEVTRSALVLKLLTYSPSGALVAAPTTSLPEKVGGTRNWDYRYCWLRDASFILHALLGLGYDDEGRAFFSWLLHATRRTLPDLHVVYDVFGRSRLSERELSFLSGYRGSRPVRVGNDAHRQLQLDIYGEVINAALEYVDKGGDLDAWQRQMLEALGRKVCKCWREPDNGIWESRGPPRRHTYSNAMCWVALNGLTRLAARGYLKMPPDLFREVMDAIRDEVESQGFDEVSRSYVSRFGGRDVDASLLLLAVSGYLNAEDTSMSSTYTLIEERLCRGPLMYRYSADWGDGIDEKEGAFGICGFWRVEYLAMAGRVDEARRIFEQNLEYANDVGLFGEEIEPETGEPLGNFPQGFTHLGLINAALTLSEPVGSRAHHAGERRRRRQQHVG